MELIKRKPRGNSFIDYTGKDFDDFVVVKLVGFRSCFAIWLCRFKKCGHEFQQYSHIIRRPRTCSQCRAKVLKQFSPRTRSQYTKHRAHMCAGWARPKVGFVTFLAYLGRCPRGHVLARKNRRRPFGPRNAKWIPKPPTLSELAKDAGITRQGMHYRLKKNGRKS